MKFYFKLLTITFALLILVPQMAVAEDNITSPVTNTALANVFVRDSAKTNVIVVDKGAKNLYQVSVEGDNADVKNTYTTIHGINEGDKLVSGDGKTPEGIYYITRWRSSESLIKNYGNYAKIYGLGSFPLNYPNPVDKIRKKTGHGIWIHGIDPVNGKDTTQGCVALHNEDLDTLKGVTRIKDPVVITSGVEFLSEDEYQSKRAELFKLFDGFINSWRSSDYEAFKNYIHPDYRGQGKKASTYLASKKYLMDIYKDKIIDIDDTIVLRQNEGNIVVDTNQFYCAENLTSYSNKRYYFAESGGGLKLISEEASSLDGSAIISQRVNNFVNNWADSWRNKNIDTYVGYYSDRFKSGRMDINAWREYKTDIFERGGDITLDLSDIKWTVSNNRYSVSFTQKYSSGTVSDLGVKTLVFDGCPGSFKILSETWAAK